MEIHHREDGSEGETTRLYRCCLCPKAFEKYQAPGGSQTSHTKPQHQCSMYPKEFDTSQALGGHMRRHREELSRLKAQEQLEIKVVHEPQTKAHDQADSENGSQVVLHSNLIEISQNTNPEGLPKTLVLFGTEERSKPFFLFGTILF
ncbi:hypothetical protein AMTRI_Chr11g154840 [Amborella trichopoda]